MELRMANRDLEMLDRAGIRELQERRLVAQVRRLAGTNEFYRRLWPAEVAQCSSIKEFQSLVPFTRKEDVFAEQAARGTSTVISTDASSIFSNHLTSGTSGLGQEVHPLTLQDYEAFAFSWPYQMTWAGIELGSSIFYTFPIGLQGGGQYSPLASHKMVMTGYYMSPYDAGTKIDHLYRFAPNVLVATPSYVTRLTAVARERGLEPAKDLPDLKCIVTAAESYPIAWAEDIMDYWGVTISEWYGSTQTGCNLAISCERGVVTDGKRGALHCMEHRLFCEILDPETHEPVPPGAFGELAVTSLFREAFPVVRFLTGDRVRQLEEPCPCGRELLALEAGTIGRIDDMIKIRAQNVWPSAVDDIILSSPDVEEYAGVVALKEDGRETVTLSVELVPDCGLSAADRSSLMKRFRSEIKQRIGVSMDVAEVPYMSLPRFEFKVRRWQDLRLEGREYVRYTVGQ